jgi:integrase/recombinase XerD
MNQDLKKTNTFTHKQAVDLRDEAIWRDIGSVRLFEAVEAFLKTFSQHTQIAYAGAFRIFFEKRLLNPDMNLQTFALTKLESLLDAIKERSGVAEASKQSRAAAFISFTSFLSRRSGGIIRKVAINREKGQKTFSKIRDKASTEALTKEEWESFITSLEANSVRDALIAKMLLQGAKRISEVLEATIEAINWESGTITFAQKKSDVLEKTTVIHFPQAYLSGLRKYLGKRKNGLIFITTTGRPILRHWVYMCFATAGIEAGIGKITPHQLRATGITWLRGKGFSAEDIQKVSGHSDIKTVTYYDKTALENNPSRQVSLI